MVSFTTLMKWLIVIGTISHFANDSVVSTLWTSPTSGSAILNIRFEYWWCQLLVSALAVGTISSGEIIS